MVTLAYATYAFGVLTRLRLAGPVSGTVGRARRCDRLLGIVLGAALDSGPRHPRQFVAGTGFGAAFLGALRTLARAIPPTGRSSVMSAFYLVAYGSLSVPAILAGALAHAARGLNSTFEILGALFAAVALVAAAPAFRSRPEPATSPTCAPTHARQTAGTAVLDLT